jgi:hypothetical protein
MNFNLLFLVFGLYSQGFNLLQAEKKYFYNQ